jgi:hypothetical protein
VRLYLSGDILSATWTHGELFQLEPEKENAEAGSGYGVRVNDLATNGALQCD